LPYPLEAALRGERDDAERVLRKALEIADEIQNPPQLWLTHAALGDFHRRRGDFDSAQRAYVAARATIDATTSQLRTPSLRAALENAALTRRIRDSAGKR
jgi:Tetratricopeptide repeat